RRLDRVRVVIEGSVVVVPMPIERMRLPDTTGDAELALDERRKRCTRRFAIEQGQQVPTDNGGVRIAGLSAVGPTAPIRPYGVDLVPCDRAQHALQAS